MFVSSVFLLVTLCISARDIYFFSWLCLFLHASLDVIWSAISSRYCVISCFCDVTWPRYFWTRLPYFWTRLPYFWARRAPKSQARFFSPFSVFPKHPSHKKLMLTRCCLDLGRHSMCIYMIRWCITLQGTNISHLGKRKIIFKRDFFYGIC